MAKPVAKVKVGELIKADTMNEMIARINELEKRLAKVEGNPPKRKISEKKTIKLNNPKSKTLKVKTPKKKGLKKKTPKTEPLHYIDSIK